MIAPENKLQSWQSSRLFLFDFGRDGRLLRLGIYGAQCATPKVGATQHNRKHDDHHHEDLCVREDVRISVGMMMDDSTYGVCDVYVCWCNTTQ